MKKIYLLISFTVLSASAFSQYGLEVLKTGKKINMNSNHSRLQMDTLWGKYEQWVEPSLYAITEAGIVVGYLGGNSQRGEKQKVQVFPNTSNAPLSIREVILYFGFKQFDSGDADSKIIVKTYGLNGNTPGDSLSSATLLVSDVVNDGDAWNIVTFDNHAKFAGGFGVGLDFKDITSGDYIGLFTSENGGGNKYGNLAWEQLSDDSWSTFKQSWNTDVELGIFPIVDLDVVGMKTIKNNLFNIYQNMPNPFSNISSVFYELNEAAAVSFEVFDMTGKSMVTKREGLKSAGKYRIEIDATDYPSGIYHYTMTIGDQRATKKMVVFK